MQHQHLQRPHQFPMNHTHRASARRRTGHPCLQCHTELGSQSYHHIRLKVPRIQAHGETHCLLQEAHELAVTPKGLASLRSPTWPQSQASAVHWALQLHAMSSNPSGSKTELPSLRWIIRSWDLNGWGSLHAVELLNQPQMLESAARSGIRGPLAIW